MEHGPTSSSPLEFETGKESITLKLHEVFNGWKMEGVTALKVCSKYLAIIVPK